MSGPRALLTAYPMLNLVLCAFCAYAGILCVMMAVSTTAKLNFFAAAAFSFLAGYHLFRNFQKTRKKS